MSAACLPVSLHKAETCRAARCKPAPISANRATAPAGRKHRYEFTLTALKVARLPNITADATPALVGFFTKANSLGEAKFTVEYQR